eukprot:gene8242-8432_t
MIALLVFLQAVSCGLFFCVTLPFGHRPYVDYKDLITEIDQRIAVSSKAAAGSTAVLPSLGGVAASQLQATGPKLIPRVVHQTYRSRHVPAAVRQLMRSWQAVNGHNWQVRFYHDEACSTFVRGEFPEYLEAYMSLPKDIERADFFKYMLILRLGGVYADIDVECKQPLDPIIQPSDTLLSGWDTELVQPQLAAQQGFPRQRQVASWFFAAAPGHPVLRQLCDHIAHHARTAFANNSVRDTQERTGQGVWTDLVLQHALSHPAAKGDDPWQVRVLPRVAFGVHTGAAADVADAAVGEGGRLHGDLPGVVVLHHFMGRWQKQQSWQHQELVSHRKALQILGPLISWARPINVPEGVESVQPSSVSLFPVSVSFTPSFTMMTNLVGHGDRQSAADVSAAVTAHGTWQAGVAAYRQPAVVEALVGALSKPHHNRQGNSHKPARAAPGARAASVLSQDGGSSTVAVRSTPVAAGNVQMAAVEAPQAAATAKQLVQQKSVLVDVGAGHGFFSLAAAARGHHVVAFETSSGSLAAFKASIAYNGFGNAIELHDRQAPAAAGTDGSYRLLQQQDALVRRRRGYPHLSDGPSPELPDDGKNNSNCAVAAQRRRLSDVLGNNTSIAALRLSVHGHEGWVLQGALDYLRLVHKPQVIHVEFWPAAMRASGFHAPVQLLSWLFDLGYTDIAHAGRVCDQRWLNATSVLRAQGTLPPSTAQLVLQQPTWCKLRPDRFQLLVEQADQEVPENLLFVLGQHLSPAEGIKLDLVRVYHGSVGFLCVKLPDDQLDCHIDLLCQWRLLD